MSPKEKAEELADIYFEIVKDIDWRKTNSPPMFMAHVKKCALTSVDNMLKHMSFHFGQIGVSTLEYWNEVKQEIEKL